MRKSSQIKVKKLALAYKTGWEYVPEGEEAGSVLTDIFLDMAEENRWRYEQIWGKQERVFQGAVPVSESGEGSLSGELAVKVSDEGHGEWLEEGCEVHLPQENGALLRFQTVRPLQLTAARLQYAVYCKGTWAWLTYEEDGEGQSSISLFRRGGKELSHPVFRWHFQALCDGMEDFCFAVEFRRPVQPAVPLPGKWTVSDGETDCPADWGRTSSGFCLRGGSPGFAKNLEGEMYEIRLELSPEEELTEEWAELLWGGYVLTVAAEEREPDLYITDSGAEEGGKIFPFGTIFSEAVCCYLSCDRIMAGAEKEIRLRFRESYMTEEKLPEPHPEEYEKWYKKYPWLRQTETVQEWRAEETRWEYFNGSLWRPLPGSEGWDTCCHPREAGEKAYSWKRPRDMAACVVEGEEHFYIRLRLCRTRNAYAMYYRKSIPVLEEIRFSVGERRLFPTGQELPDIREISAEKMYLGFDRDVTPDNCWYTGQEAFSFAGKTIRGRGVRFGREAFWVELTEKREEEFPFFLSNHIPVRQVRGEAGGVAEKERIRAGEIFYLEPRGMGTLEAVCLADICCERAGAPVISGRQAAEHYFAHWGRLLTPMDMELLLQERHPPVRVRSCVFRKEEGTLDVVLSYPCGCEKGKGTWPESERPYVSGHGKDKGTWPESERTYVSGHGKGKGTQPESERSYPSGEELSYSDGPEENVRARLRGETEEEMRGMLSEIGKWLEEVLTEAGPVWLRGCSVNCSLDGTAMQESHPGT